MKQWPSDKSENPADPAASDSLNFGGFKNLNSTLIPDEFFDVLAVQLSEAELRVLLYIMRRTFGFKKKADAISLSQLTGGIRKRDGSVLDHGTGLSKPAVLKAVSGLQAKSIINIEKHTGEDGRNEVNVYQLRFADDQSPISTAEYSENKYNSQPEYSKPEQYPDLSPDPRFVSARPANLQPGRQPREQRQSGDFYPFSRNNQEEYRQESEITPGVKQLYREGKPSLPGVKTSTQGSKNGLPGVVNKNDRGGQVEAPNGVNQLYRQHESQQESRKQNTDTQTVWRANGALAYQPTLIEEREQVSSQPDELYINLEELAGAMYELGLSQKLVLDLIQSYPAEYLWEKVSLTRQQMQGHQPTVKNTAGYLRRAISEDYRPLPARGFKSTQSQPSAFADRFQGTLAYLNKNHSAQAFAEDDYSFETETNSLEVDVEVEENFYREETAPLPPIYRQTTGSQIMPGESRSGMPPTPPLHARGANRLSSGGAGNGSGPRESAGSQLQVSQPASPEVSIPVYEPATGLWEKIYEDLEGRFRLGDALDCLRGALFFLPEPDDCENYVTLRLASAWQERALGMTARSAIALAVRQRLGPGFKVNICSA